MAKDDEPQADRQGADAVADTHDDGLTPEERGQFDQMRSDSSGPAPEPAAGAPAGGDGADAAAAAAAAAKPGDGAAGAEADDDGDDEPAAAGATPGAAGAEKTPRRVSFSKYKRETEALAAKVAAAEGTISEQRAAQARLDERLRIINEALTTPAETEAKPKVPPLPAAEDDPEPDKNADLFAWLDWKDRDDKRFRHSLQKRDEADQTAQQQRTESETIQRTYLQDANAYAQQNPQFVPAYQFLMQSRTLELAEYFFGKDLTVEGATLTPDEVAKINQTVAAEERQLVAGAIRDKKRPAERVFALAKARGFKPQAAAAGDGKPANGAAPAANVAAKADAGAAPGALGGDGGQPNVREEIDRVKNGQEAALSLSAGGGAPARTIDAKTLVAMSDEDFGAMVDQMTPAEFKRIAGG